MMKSLAWRAAVVLSLTLAAGSAAQGQARKSVLLDPSASFWKARAPDTVTASVETSRGVISLELIREWSPAGVDRFYNLARAGYYDDSRVYRVLFGFVAQFGTSSSVAVTQAWATRHVAVDPPREKNARGTIAFAQSRPGDRTTHVFINLADNAQLDTLRFVPFGRVKAGMEVADSLYFMYGDQPTSTWGGDPKRLYREGNRYLDAMFPKLDRVVRVVVK